jgi:hypothetical protein
MEKYLIVGDDAANFTLVSVGAYSGDGKVYDTVMINPYKSISEVLRQINQQYNLEIRESDVIHSSI